MSEITIPEKHQDFIKAVARLAKDAGLESVSGTIRPSFDDAWRDDIQFNWKQGRHGEDSWEVFITSTKTIRTKIDN